VPAPKADPPKCDVPGCGMLAVTRTDGTEKDVSTRRVADGAIDEPLNRPAIPFLNVCARHLNWPHSDDAKAFALTDAYKGRK
jgi:hypothetical protein